LTRADAAPAVPTPIAAAIWRAVSAIALGFYPSR
jgi:hypothetical protein